MVPFLDEFMQSLKGGNNGNSMKLTSIPECFVTSEKLSKPVIGLGIVSNPVFGYYLVCLSRTFKITTKSLLISSRSDSSFLESEIDSNSPQSIFLPTPPTKAEISNQKIYEDILKSLPSSQKPTETDGEKELEDLAKRFTAISNSSSTLKERFVF